MDFIPYNSRLTYHKSPFGAVREGERVTMRIVLPRSLGCTGASLIIDSDGGSSRVYPMTWERMECTDEVVAGDPHRRARGALLVSLRCRKA